MRNRKMRGRTQRWWFFIGVALLVHGVLVVAITYREVLERPEPVLSGKFVKRRPLQQPYLERRVERPAPLPVLKRSVTASRPYARSTVQYTLAPVHPQLLGARLEVPELPPRPLSLARGLPSSGRLRSLPTEVSVQAADHLDLGLELLDIDHLDTGRYRALVVQDPADRRNLEGYVHFSAVAIPSVRRMEGEDWGPWRWESIARSVDREMSTFPDLLHSANIRALASLAAELEEQTGLKAVLDEDLDLQSPAVLESPFILLTSGRRFEPSAEEAEQLGRYLVSGGFAYVEQVGAPVLEFLHGTFRDLHSLRDLIRMALASQGLSEGTDWSFEPLDGDHPLFHSYYDIGTLPTNYWRAVYSDVFGYHSRHPQDWGFRSDPTYEGIPPYLEGIHLNGRLVLVYSQQNFRDFWRRRPERHLTRASEVFIWDLNESPLHRPSSDPAIRLGINVVVFALTQEGSLARRFVKAR